MSSTHADKIARPLVDEIVREDVIARLDQRWSHALTLLEAPGGYGKTRALAQAVRSNEEDPIGVDRYLRLRPGHVDPARLAAAILDALGVSGEPAGTDDDLVERIVDELAYYSPTKICLILDDVHLITPSAEAVSLLVDIVRLLPTNSHVVIAGRTMPELPLARLAADDGLVEIDETNLLFGADEIDLLVERHNIDRELLSSLAGWPALIRLAVVAGKAGPQEFLMQEIIEDLAPQVVRALRVAAMAGIADSELFERCGVEISTEQLADRVPLVDLSPDGVVRPHDLWSEIMGAVQNDDSMAGLVEVIARWHSENWRHDEAIALAASTPADGLARILLMEALDASDLRLHSASTGRWLELFGGQANIDDDDAELLLLRGWHARLSNGPGHGDDDVTAALALFGQRGDALGEARASVEHAFRGFLAGDVGPVLDAMKRSPRLVESGVTFLQPLGEMTNAVIAELSGDFVRSLEHSERALRPGLRREFAELTLRHRTTLNFLVGDGDAAVATAIELVQFAPNKQNDLLLKLSKFANGDIADVVEAWDDLRYFETDNIREDYTFSVASVFVDACLGITPELAKVREAAWDRPRERMQLALCEWCAEVIDDNEAMANTALGDVIAELGLADPLVIGEIRRFLVSCYVAVPQVRHFLEQADVLAELGPYHLERLQLARILMALRDETRPDWSTYRNPEHTIGSMSLPWSVEFASGLVLHDEELGIELADALFATTGARTRHWLRLIAASDKPTAAGAEQLLKMLPAPPARVTHVRTQDTVAIAHGGIEKPVARQRVRQLLLLLVLRETVSREQAMTILWPDKDTDKARNNFRITLSHLRDELEPDRRSGEPSFHLRQRGNRVVLQRSEHLTIDLWAMIDGLAAADAIGAVGERSHRLELLGPVADLWQPSLLADLVDVADISAEITALQARLRDATVEVAEAHLSSGRNDHAERLGRKMLEQDHFDERAHAIVIAASLGSGRDSQANQAIDACLTMLHELNVSPAPATRMLLRRARYPEDHTRRTA